MVTKPVSEHAWLQKLVGEWRVVTEMVMAPDQPKQTSEGTESVKSLGGHWAFAEGTGTIPEGSTMTYYSTLGYDVSFKVYRGCWFGSVSTFTPSCFFIQNSYSPRIIDAIHRGIQGPREGEKIS